MLEAGTVVIDWCKYELEGFDTAIYRRIGQFMEIKAEKRKKDAFIFAVDEAIEKYLPKGFSLENGREAQLLFTDDVIVGEGGLCSVNRRRISISGIRIKGWENVQVTSKDKTVYEKPSYDTRFLTGLGELKSSDSYSEALYDETEVAKSYAVTADFYSPDGEKKELVDKRKLTQALDAKQRAEEKLDTIYAQMEPVLRKRDHTSAEDAEVLFCAAQVVWGSLVADYFSKAKGPSMGQGPSIEVQCKTENKKWK